MEGKKRRKTGKILFALAVLLIVALLVALPFILDARQSEKTKGSVLSAEVKTGSIQKNFSGTGTITEQEALEASVPDGVEVTEYLVKNGQLVQGGDPVATIDRVSVMETISALKTAMTETEEELNSLGDDYYAYINAPAQGRIKAVYCKTGDAVEEVMLEHGALAVVSLDGLMGVKIPDTAALSIGQSVSVILSDGTEVPGRVELAVDGEASITISDKYGSIDETVQVLLDQQPIGSGRLFVHSAWKAVASSGTVYTVFVSKDMYCWADGTLISIEGSSDGSYERLLEEYRGYEDLLEELFRLYQDGVLKAPADGVVSGVDDKLLTQLAYFVTPSLELISYVSGEAGEKENAEYSYRIGMITSVNGDGSLSAKRQEWETPIPDYNDPPYLVTEASSMTVPYENFYPNYLQWNSVQKVFEKDTQPAPAQIGDVYLFVSGDAEGIVYITHNEYTPPAATPVPSSSPGDGENYPPGDMGGIFDGDMPSIDMGGFSGMGGGSNIPSGGGGGTAGTNYGGSTAGTEPRYSMNRTTILSVTPQETVTVSVTIDELDILDVHKGQEASVTLDALPGRVFTGVIAEVNRNASNSGGHSKYSAVVELERIPDMLGGMNASVSITTETLEDILILPAEAFDEQDGQTVAYTAFDTHTEKPGSPVAVKTGLSDGLSVQILSGLSEGEVVWYEYFEAKDENEVPPEELLNR